MANDPRKLVPWLPAVQSLLLSRQAQLLQTYAAASYRLGTKEGDDIVTEVDTELQAALAGTLERFGLNMFGEESPGGWPSAHHGELVVVDPLDGTANFAGGVPCFGTMLVALRDGQPWASLVWIPFESLLARNGFYLAVRGHGAWRCREDGSATRLAVSRTARAAAAALAIEGPAPALVASPYPARLARRCRTQRYGFSSSWCGTRLASGAAHGLPLDALLCVDSAPWDCLPIALLVQEAGGRVTDLQGRPYGAGPRQDLLMSNGLLHEELLQALAGE